MELETPQSSEVNVKSSIKWYDKLYHEFMVYLPVILLLFLIMLIFITYYAKFLLVLLTSAEYSLSNYPLALTSDPTQSTNRGITLTIVTCVLFVLLIIALLRTVFMDPGFFKDPTQFEYNLVLKNSLYRQKSKQTLREVKEDMTSLLKDNPEEIDQANKYLFFSDFSSIINNYPLTFNEYSLLNINVDQYLGNKRSPSVINQMEKSVRAQQLKSHLEKPESSKEQSSPLNLEDPYENFTGIELMKLPLCNSCLRWKVERSHHCRQCGKCILKMDHHCPWLANCIGFRNYKFFCLIHLYGTINSLIVAFTFWEVVYNSYTDINRSVWEASFNIFVYVCNVGLLCFLIWLFAFNWVLIFSGQTVIEQSERERFPSSKPDNIYDLGNYRNFTVVFGRNPLVWFIPFFPNYEGEGIVYETNNLNKH